MFDDHLYDKDILTKLREEHNIDMDIRTLYLYKQRIQEDQAELWDLVAFDSAKYRATRLLHILEEGQTMGIRDYHDRTLSPKERKEAFELASLCATYAYRLVKDGPDFKQIPLIKQVKALTNTNHALSKDKPTQTPTNDVITTNQVDKDSSDV